MQHICALSTTMFTQGLHYYLQAKWRSQVATCGFVFAICEGLLKSPLTCSTSTRTPREPFLGFGIRCRSNVLILPPPSSYWRWAPAKCTHECASYLPLCRHYSECIQICKSSVPSAKQARRISLACKRNKRILLKRQPLISFTWSGETDRKLAILDSLSHIRWLMEEWNMRLSWVQWMSLSYTV